MPDRLYRKRGSKVYYGWFYRAGQRRTVCTYQTDRKLALKELHRLAAEAHGENGPASDAPPHSVTQAFAHWFAEGLHGRAEATVDFYEQVSSHVRRLLGAVDVNGMSDATVRAYLATRREEGGSAALLVKEMVALRQALKHAHKRGDLRRDPRGIVPEMKSAYHPRERFLTHEEFGRLVASFRTKARRDWLWIAVYTGGRKSEIERLAWSDVRLESGWLTLPGRKTAAARRPVPIHPELRAVLSAMVHRKDGLVVGPWEGVVHDLRIKCQRLGIARATTNDLRRTFASWLVQQKTPLKVVAKLMGHTSTTMVDRVYGHLEDSQLEDAVQRLPSRGPKPVAHK